MPYLKRSLLSSIVILNFFAILVVYALVHYREEFEEKPESYEVQPNYVYSVQDRDTHDIT